VRWLYQNAKTAPVEMHHARALDAQRRCRTYTSWEVSPVALELLLDCKAKFAPWREPRLPGSLVDDFYAAWGGEPGWEESYGAWTSEPAEQGPLVTGVALETVIEYAVARYGREYVPRLLFALDEHQSWQTLIPALFGVSAEKFEAGWQTFLADKYDKVLSLDESTSMQERPIK
jgi:hypothetical protein